MNKIFLAIAVFSVSASAATIGETVRDANGLVKIMTYDAADSFCKARGGAYRHNANLLSILVPWERRFEKLCFLELILMTLGFRQNTRKIIKILSGSN